MQRERGSLQSMLDETEEEMTEVSVLEARELGVKGRGFYYTSTMNIVDGHH